jgi:hypothetical protein
LKTNISLERSFEGVACTTVCMFFLLSAFTHSFKVIWFL